MSDEQPTPKPRGSKPRPVARPRKSPAVLPTIPATDASDSDVPITLAPDAVAGTHDRALALDWIEQGLQVRRRPDGVYEQVLPGEAPKPKAQSLREQFADWPDIDTLERRLQDPHLESSAPVKFTDEVHLPKGAKPKWYKRWIDTHIPSRLQILTQPGGGGYRKATWDLIANRSEIADRDETNHDNVVRRGDKGRYVLIYMPFVYWERIKTQQAIKRNEKERAGMAGIAAAQASAPGKLGGLGDASGAAAEQIESGFRGSITELKPQSIEQFAASGLPKDIRDGAMPLEAE